jgi:hypothetical protein
MKNIIAKYLSTVSCNCNNKIKIYFFVDSQKDHNKGQSKTTVAGHTSMRTHLFMLSCIRLCVTEKKYAKL